MGVLLLALPLAACAPQPANLTVTPGPSATATVTQTPTATPQPSATATAAPPTPSPTPASQTSAAYRLTVDFNFERRSAAVEEYVRYTNRSSEAMTDLRFVVPPTAYANAIQIKKVAWPNGEKIAGVGWLNNLLYVPLPQALEPGQQTAVEISYDLLLPAQSAFNGPRPVPFGYTARQSNLVDWYPFTPPYVPGQGWLAHPNGFYGENLVSEVADFEVHLTLSGNQTGLVVAASAPEQPEGAGTRYELKQARSFALSFSPDYQVSRQYVGSVEIRSYAFTPHAAAGETAGQVTAESVGLFQELFGSYPHTTLSVVEADFLDGMEYDGLYFLSKGFYNLASGSSADYLTAIAAHETAHQWWYGLIGNDQAMEPWLDEALATYSERLYYERLHPESLDWWWEYRVLYYHPNGWVNSNIYDQIGQADSYEQYRNAVYLNGAVFLEEIRKQVGDEAFLAFLKDYAKEHRGRIASGQDFFTVLARHSSANLNDLLARFFKPPEP